MMNLRQDIRLGFRTLLKSRGLAAIAIFALALGIGANTAIFSVVNTVLLRPLPYPDVERVMMVWDSNPTRGWDTFAVAPGNFVDWQARQKVFETLVGMRTGAFVLTGLAEALNTALIALGFDLPGAKQVFYGICLLLVVVVLPDGVWPWLARLIGVEEARR